MMRDESSFIKSAKNGTNGVERLVFYFNSKNHECPVKYVFVLMNNWFKRPELEYDI